MQIHVESAILVVGPIYLTGIVMTRLRLKFEDKFIFKVGRM